VTAQLRCAVYTRKSTEEGLDQSFNSLHAQRDACEAYIHSQAGEGWRLLPVRYDDGGYSGGNLNRPAMQRLLADVDAGKVDVIVVYKVDRLTRSLLDFAKIVERLDVTCVWFVSVTQAFNTTTSMGRLTLNVLLSFAQFEREVTGERIRDKIAASKARGVWMGGNLPLGYDLRDRCLFVNAAEADNVRHIFSRYLELKSGVQLMKELRTDAIASKRWVARSGQERGGAAFSCSALYYLLQNRLYRGEIIHRGVRYKGEHEAIVSAELFDAVQEALAVNRRTRRQGPKLNPGFPLARLVHNIRGELLKTSFSYGRRGRLYRYYVMGSVGPTQSDSSKAGTRVPALPLERLVLQTVGKLLQRHATWAEALLLVSSVELRERSIELVIGRAAILQPYETLKKALARLRPLAAPNQLVPDGEHLRLIVGAQHQMLEARTGEQCEPICRRSAQDGPTLLRLAHRLLEMHSMSPLAPETHSDARAPFWQRQRRIMALGLLSPKLQNRILRGAPPSAIEWLFVERLPLAWVDQMSAHGQTSLPR
jgi:DNA invertase Pin-like site-specific DNA recombinase